MKRYFYFVARFIRRGVSCFSAGVQENHRGFFDFVEAAKFVSKKEDVDDKEVIITFWSDTNSVMMGKFTRLHNED